MALDVRQEQAADGRPRFFLMGDLDERANVGVVLEGVKGDAVLNLSGIDHINSMGLLLWLRGMAKLTSRHAITVEALSHRLSIQANYVADLFGRANITSCMAPYHCAACGSSLNLEVTAPQLDRGRPVPTCPKCSQPMKFDEVDEYFAFLTDPKL